ncbi:MAG: hypothetical protein QOD11_2727 [Bradyrhizobium sp.]|jgi:hypothetical protein|nr:hypothetical protein [Bradyrhizobium sp.]
MIDLVQWTRRVRTFAGQPLAKRIIYLLIVTWIATGAGYCFGLHNSQNKLVASLFMSWMGDVLFFSVVGSLVAIISSLPAALEPYEHRVNILFQGLSGSQVDYAKSELSKLGNYSDYLRILISIQDDEEDWLRLTTTSTLRIKNLIEDVVTTYRLPVSDSEQLKNPPGKIGGVVTFLVDGQRIFSERAGEMSAREDYLVEIGGEKAPEIMITSLSWIGRHGYVAHTPARFTKSFSLSIINRSDQRIFLKSNIPSEADLIELEACQPSALILVEEQKDIRPPTQVYDLRLFKTREDATSYLENN